MNTFGEIACTRGATQVDDGIVDVSLLLVDGERLVRNQLVKLQLAFTTLRPFSNLGAVIRIFDQFGRCAFAKHFVDLDESEICRQIELGRHVLVVHFSAALPVGWYAVTFSLSENPSGDFRNSEGWIAVAEQSCYVPFYVGNDPALPGRGYCSLPVHSYLAPSGSQDAVGGQTESFPEFPWFLDEPRYSMGQIIAALHEFLPDLNPEQRDVAGELVLNPGCGTLKLPAGHPRFHSQVGQRSDHGIASTGEAGALLFGPYMPARPGRYKVAFFGTGKLQVGASATADVVACKGTVLLGRIDLMSEDGSAEWEIPFVVPDPGVHDLEFRVFVGSGVNFELSKVVVAACEGDGQLRALLRSELRWALPVRESVAMVLVPSISWLPFVLSITDQVHCRFKKRSVLVFLDTHPIMGKVDALGSSLIGAIGIGELPRASFEEVFAVISHDFGWGEQSSKLLQMYPEAAFWVYADGFRGELCIPVRHPKEPKLAFFFGHAASSLDGVEEVCIPASGPVNHIKAIAKLCEEFDPGLPIAPEPENVAVIYMRYWGVGAYAMSAEQIVESIVATMHAVLSEGVLVVVKNDPRVSQDVMATLLDRLKQEQWQSMALEDYLESIGIERRYASLDAPYLFSRGILASASYHFVFDSSVGFYVAEQANRGTETRIIFGAINPAWNGGPNPIVDGRYIDYILRCDSGAIEKSIDGAVSIVAHYSQSFSRAIDFKCHASFRVDEMCFVASLK